MELNMILCKLGLKNHFFVNSKNFPIQKHNGHCLSTQKSPLNLLCGVPTMLAAENLFPSLIKRVIAVASETEDG